MADIPHSECGAPLCAWGFKSPSRHPRPVMESGRHPCLKNGGPSRREGSSPSRSTTPVFGERHAARRGFPLVAFGLPSRRGLAVWCSAASPATARSPLQQRSGGGLRRRALQGHQRRREGHAEGAAAVERGAPQQIALQQGAPEDPEQGGERGGNGLPRGEAPSRPMDTRSPAQSVNSLSGTWSRSASEPGASRNSEAPSSKTPPQLGPRSSERRGAS